MENSCAVYDNIKYDAHLKRDGELLVFLCHGARTPNTLEPQSQQRGEENYTVMGQFKGGLLSKKVFKVWKYFVS